jgi:hypothetical protein
VVERIQRAVAGDRKLEPLASARVLDGACMSGAFLVESTLRS